MIFNLEIKNLFLSVEVYQVQMHVIIVWDTNFLGLQLEC